MKRESLFGILFPFVIIITAAIGMFAGKQYEESIYSTARQQFESKVLSEIQQEMRDLGLNDLRIDVEYEEISSEEWTERVYFFYHSNQIDRLYTTVYDSENSKELANLLLSLRDIQDKYCKEYRYNIRDIDVTILFKDNFTNYFTVKNRANIYRIDTEHGFHSLWINDLLAYYSGSTYPSNETAEENNVDKSEKIEIPKYPSDLYDAYDYDDPADFYYDRGDVFESYEEAEDYWNEVWE